MVSFFSLVSAQDKCLDSSTVFCSGFEEGTINNINKKWGSPYAGSQVVADAGPFNSSGNHVGHFVTSAPAPYILPTIDAKVYFRWYMKWDANYSFSEPNHAGGGFAVGSPNSWGSSGVQPTGADFGFAWLQPWTSDGKLAFYTYSKGMYMDLPWGDGIPCSPGSNCKTEQQEKNPLPTMLNNKWYCLEIMMDVGTPSSNWASANGSLNLWIDGVEYGPWKVWWRTVNTMKISRFGFMYYFHDGSTGLNAYVDDVIVSKKYIGPGNRVGIADGPAKILLSSFQNENTAIGVVDIFGKKI